MEFGYQAHWPEERLVSSQGFTKHADSLPHDCFLYFRLYLIISWGCSGIVGVEISAITINLL